MTDTTPLAKKTIGTSFYEVTTVRNQDPLVAQAICAELYRQQNQLELIASENIVSRAVLEAQGSVLTNKYAEGYPGRRYYGGCEYVDVVERVAIERVCQLYGCNFANVQPHSGAQANQAVFLALLHPGDTFLGMSLDAGGHLTHGAAPNLSGKWFNPIAYGVDPQTGLIDMDEVARLAHHHHPKLIIAGGSAYPRILDFKKFRQIADSVGAYLMVDMAHYAGLIAGGAYPNPFPHAHVVTSTTHKTLRGPRGGLILTHDEALAKKINSAVFPGLQGGPLMHVIAAKAVAFGEAQRPEFKKYAHQIVANARSLAQALETKGYRLVTGGTDSHMLLLNLQDKGVSGKDGAAALERAGMTCNKNAIPGDPLGPMITSGIRLGTPAGTTRGLSTEDFDHVGTLVAEVLDGLASKGPLENGEIENKVYAQIHALCQKYPIYDLSS